MMIKRKYLVNENILREIHESKNSFCYFVDEKYKNYDIILDSKDQITVELRDELLKKKKEKYFELVQFQNNQIKRKKKFSDEELKKLEKTLDIVVFRVYTDEHIPEEFKGYEDIRTRYNNVFLSKKATFNRENESFLDFEYENEYDENFFDRTKRLNFRPFKHYILSENNRIKEVGRSHWKGNLEKGYFSQNHGKLTNELGKMILLLVEKYSQKGNWRNYTYLEEMKGTAIVQLCQIALKFDESKSLNPFAYYTSSICNSFTKILNIEKKNQAIRDDILMDKGFNPSFGRQIEEEAKEKDNISFL